MIPIGSFGNSNFLKPIAIYIVAMVTTIQVSEELRDELKLRKLSDKESFEGVIWDLMEDSMELSEETKLDIKAAEADIKAGRVVSLEQIEKEFGL